VNAEAEPVEGEPGERIAKASTGYVHLRFVKHPAGVYGVDVTAYREDGWRREGFPWISNNADGASLADQIVRIAQLPRDEAERLAGEALRVWQGDEWQRQQAETIPRRFYLILPLVIVGALAGWVVALILLLV
jgi:hypothetical protein